MMKLYTGCVENRFDPLKLGRCQVRIVGLHTENKVHLPTTDLPWAYPVTPITSAGTSGIGAAPIGPVEGSWVLITFMDPENQQPMMLGTLGGAFQTPEALEAGNVSVNTVDASGNVDLSNNANFTQSERDAAVPVDNNTPANVGESEDSITGPLAELISKGESGSAGYDAFNRGSGAKPGTGSIGGQKLSLTKMPIKDIMAAQALSPNSPDRLFAVGKYQCIPTTLREACTALNIDVQTTFNERVQDLICQEYLIARKRPKLVAYYRNPNQSNDQLIKEAGRSLAAEFASLEDPDYPGFPYGGENGRYYKAGNKVKTPWSLVQSTLQQEWTFRNTSKKAAATASIGGGDKIEMGTDYYGVVKATPKDDSAESTPREAESATDGGLGGLDGGLGGLDIGGLDLGGFDLGSIAGLDSIGGLEGLSGFGLDGILGSLPTDLVGNITDQISQYTDLVNTFDIGASLSDLSGGLTDQLTSQFGDLSATVTSFANDNLGGLKTNILDAGGNILPPNIANSLNAQISNLGGGGIANPFTAITNQISGVLGQGTNVEALFASKLNSLSSFGGSITDIASNLGISNVSGSVTELVSKLGIANPTKDSILNELVKIANSPVGQAKSLLTKLEAEGEPTTTTVEAVGMPNADGTISTGLPVDPNLGFQDPNGVYPKYKNEPDTNRLAAGNNLGRTYVVKKEAAMKMGIKIANGGTWDQSPVPYNATYPYNKVTETESGHIMEFDDTPGSERIHLYHKTGSFIEWDANGTQVNRIVGDGYEIIERNGHVYVVGAMNVTVDGALNVRTDNIFNLEVSGAAKINIYNDANINISGNSNLAVGGEFNLKANKVNIESAGQLNLKAATGLNIMSTKDMNIKSEAGMFLEAEADINIKGTGSGVFIGAENSIHLISDSKKVNIQATEDINLKSGAKLNAESTDDLNLKSGAKLNAESTDDLNLKSGANLNAEADSELNIKSSDATNVEAGADLSLQGSNTYIDGGIVDIANGSSASAGSAGEAGAAGEGTAALEAKKAGQADLELPIETRGTSGVSNLPKPGLATRGSETGFDSPDTGNSVAYANRKIENNEVSKSDIEGSKYSTQKEKPAANSATSPGSVTGLDAIRNMPADQYTAGMKLSKHFTLGDLTKGGVRIPRVTYNVNGTNITPQEIVCNMRVLAEKVLDPIRDKFGKFTITSAFRRPPFGGAPGDLGTQKEGGDHPIGCAADIVFPGGKAETFKICNEIVKLLPSWNQVIMEYNGSQYWIHVSCRPAGNKGHMFTMNHHATYAGTFPTGGFVLV
jgi:uncharacterized protein (DUF2345 family)